MLRPRYPSAPRLLPGTPPGRRRRARAPRLCRDSLRGSGDARAAPAAGRPPLPCCVGQLPGPSRRFGALCGGKVRRKAARLKLRGTEGRRTEGRRDGGTGDGGRRDGGDEGRREARNHPRGSRRGAGLAAPSPLLRRSRGAPPLPRPGAAADAHAPGRVRGRVPRLASWSPPLSPARASAPRLLPRYSLRVEGRQLRALITPRSGAGGAR